MGVLNIKDRIVLRLLDDFRKVELERRVVLTIQHHETHGVDSDFLDDLAQGHEIAGTLRHFHRLAVAHELDQLAQLDVKLDLADPKAPPPPRSYA